MSKTSAAVHRVLQFFNLWSFGFVSDFEFVRTSLVILDIADGS